MLSPLGPYFLIRINRREQSVRKQKIGSLFLAETHVKMEREVQAGEIVDIGFEATQDFPEAKIGHILLIHYFVTGKEAEGTDDSTYHVDTDEDYNYYMVASRSINGRRNECYGVFDGESIIPHSDFIFLEAEKKEEVVPLDGFLNQNTTVSSGGLVVFKQWRETRSSVTEKNKTIQTRIKSLSNMGGGITDEIKNEIFKLEQEMLDNSARVNKKSYDPYIVVSANNKVKKWFGCEINPGDTIYVLNNAANTTIEYLGIEYRVVKIGYISFPHNFLKEAVKNYRLKSA
jgi:ferredoxin-fold anticodon binding domain-containing protein